MYLLFRREGTQELNQGKVVDDRNLAEYYHNSIGKRHLSLFGYISTENLLYLCLRFKQ